MSNVYTESVKDYRREAHKRVRLCHRSCDHLVDKSTTYARSIKALLDIHERVAELWDGVPDELPDVGRDRCRHQGSTVCNDNGHIFCGNCGKTL